MPVHTKMEPLTPLGKSSWIREFLRRVEVSTISKAREVGDEEAVISRLEKETTPQGWFSLLSSPQISAYFNQSKIAGLVQPLRLAEIEEHDATPISLGSERPVILQNPHAVFCMVMRNMGRGSQGESSRNASVVTDASVYKKHEQRIRAALDLLQETCPEYYALVVTYMRAMVFVNEGASFRGATSYHTRGLSYFRPREQWTELVWAEELLHESTHNYMQALNTFDPILIGDNSLKPTVPGPLRSDVRHHYGNFQAVHVIARILRLNDALIQSGVGKEQLFIRSKDLFQRSLIPYQSLVQGAEFSPIGAEIFNAEVRTVFDPKVCEEDTSWFRKTLYTLVQS